jgi:hypothetical protein
MQQALDALSGVADWVNLRTSEHPWDQYQRVEPAIDALRAALAQQAKPVAMDKLIQLAWKMGFDAAKAEQVAVQAEPVVDGENLDYLTRD